MDSHYQTVGGKMLPSENRSGKSWSWGIAIHILCLLWLGPIITLLYLNFSQYIIGPSVWCPLGKCSIYDDGDYSPAKASHNDRSDHNTNGMLLFAAKGLEVWFTFVAGLLVYEAQKVLRESNGGLPPRYSLTYLEFSDLLNLFNIPKWTRPIRDAYHSSNGQKQISKLCAFVLLACFMTLLVNLMGPATGVLILPSVQSVDQRHNASELFKQMQSQIPPTVGPGLVGCNATQLQSHSYSCAEYVRGSELDSMTSFVVAPMRTIDATNNETNFLYMAGSQEEQVQFLAVNFTHNKKTKDHDAFYPNLTIPSRQTLRMISADIGQVINNTQIMEESMQVSSQRTGPAIVASGLWLNFGCIDSTELGENKSITCLPTWTTNQEDDDTSYTKCIRSGTGWNDINSQAGFSIRNLSEPNAGAEANDTLGVLVYFADKATYYGGGLNRDAHDVACLNGSLSAPCDWDDIFSPHKVNGANFNGSFSNTTIVQWSYPGYDDRLWFEFVSYLHFGLYSVDLSFGNEMYFADVQIEGDTSEELVIDPLWMLAGWSVDLNGTVDAARFPTLLHGPDYSFDIMKTDEASFEYLGLNIFAIAQTLSLISYESVVLNESTAFDRNKEHVLDNWVTRRVWAYGLGTRTSRLGVAVVCAGMVMVVFRIIFAVCNNHPKGKFTQLAASP